MKVVVDGFVFENSSQIGIWRVFYETMQRLSSDVDYTLWLRAPQKQPIPPHVNVVRDYGRYYGTRRLVVPWLRATWARRVSSHRHVARSDVFHSTYFTLPQTAGPAVVTTVHDMIPELAYCYMGADAWAGQSRDKRRAIDAAALYIAVSDATAADLVRFMPETESRIRVIPHGAEHLSPAERNLKSQPYAFFVGHRDGYKNFNVVLNAMTCDAWPADLHLRTAGRSLHEREWALIEYLGLRERVIDLGRLTDEELSVAYASATCFVFPSAVEGFGLPVLEAQINRCPVVCSDIPVFREVAGNAALFFDPRLAESLAASVAKACEPETIQRLRAAGLANTQRFSWDKAAEQTLAVYKEAIEAKRPTSPRYP
ncbi:MAG: glycosyltransferase family 4 protein [Planctomycetales bacterium]|nr:glycosyltransferase family 4 protein [Planctomycetales bacterium]